MQQIDAVATLTPSAPVPLAPERRRINGWVVQSRATIEFGAFLSPDCFWPYPYSLEQTFQALRFLVKTGQGYETEGRWGASSVFCLLSKSPSCINHTAVTPITSLDDLRMRFHYALLSRDPNPAFARWREENGISPTGKRVITFPHFKPFEGGPVPFGASESDVKAALNRLYDRAATVPLAASPNPIHLAAREPCGLKIAVHPDRFVFRVDYGLSGSRWDYTLAVVEKDEPFLLGLARAIQHHDLLTNADGLPVEAQVARLNAIRRPAGTWDDDAWSIQDRSPLPILDSRSRPRGRLFQ